MKIMTLIAMGLLVISAGVAGLGCKKKGSRLDKAFHHTADHTHAQLQEAKAWLIEKVQKQELQYIHDNIYSFEAHLDAFENQLDPEKKASLDPLLNELGVTAAAIDNSAGRKNQSATEANVQKLIEALKRLEAEYKPQPSKR